MSASSSTTSPARLFLVRHGESAGNVARAQAETNGLAQIAIEGRDVDVPLSPLGERQARALGTWFSRQSTTEQPTVVLSSPYVRAQRTASIVSAALPKPPTLRIDERLREKEFGSFNRLTRTGITERFPEEVGRRDELGKFYYRPPSGESWCDVILRLRSVLDDIKLRHGGERILIVAHQVIVLCFRYLIEELTEKEILAIDREKDVANCSITSYEHVDTPHDALVLRDYNFVAPVEEAGEEVTKAPDRPAPR